MYFEYKSLVCVLQVFLSSFLAYLFNLMLSFEEQKFYCFDESSEDFFFLSLLVLFLSLRNIFFFIEAWMVNRGEEVNGKMLIKRYKVLVK